VECHVNSSTNASLQTAAPLTPAQAAAQELLRRRHALETLGAYREYMEPTGLADFKYPHARHHVLIAHHLERLVRREDRRLMILLPPGAAKSTIANVQLCTWALARDPCEQILAVSHGESLAESFARRKRLVLQTPEWKALSGAQLAEDQASLHRFATNRGGLHIAAGVGSAITGLRASFGLIDDPIAGFETALSSTQLAKQIDWYDSDFRSRLLPDAVELLITTRWARGDLAGVLLDRHAAGQEHWVVIRLPMLADSEDDPLSRALGEPLWPDWFTARQIREAQRDPLRWSCLYQQSPLDEQGQWVGTEQLRYVDTVPEPLAHYAGVDLALSIGRGDWSAIAICGIDVKRDLVIRDVWRRRTSPDETARALLDLCDRYNVREVAIDDDNSSRVFRHVLIEACRTAGRSPLPLRLMPMRGRDKETRAAPLRGLFLSGRVSILRGDRWVPDLVSELLRFPPGSTGNDDQVDALGLVARLHAERAGAHVDPTARDPFESRPVIEKDGKLYLNRTLDDLFQERERGLRRSYDRIS
jgi:predicted phage terminase large subunit-like protein